MAIPGSDTDDGLQGRYRRRRGHGYRRHYQDHAASPSSAKPQEVCRHLTYETGWESAEVITRLRLPVRNRAFSSQIELACVEKRVGLLFAIMGEQYTRISRTSVPFFLIEIFIDSCTSETKHTRNIGR